MLLRVMTRDNQVHDDLSECASLLRDLQNEDIPLSYTLRRCADWDPHSQYPAIMRRLRWELEGFPAEEEDMIRGLERRVKRAGEWDFFYGPIDELERFVIIKKTKNRHSTSDLAPEPGGVFIAKSRFALIEDEEEVASSVAYLRGLRRFAIEIIVNHYFVLTDRFVKHFDWMI